MMRLPIALLCFVFICLSPALAAQKGPSAAAQFVQRMGDKALSSLTAQDLQATERSRRVRNLLNENFDVNIIGRFALGTYWKTATEAQKSEYLHLFEDMIVKTYTQRFAEYSGQEFKVGGTIEASATDSVVSSQIVQKNGPPLAVDWRVRNKGGQMKVIDVIVEGVSMSVTQRSDFASVIQSGGGKVEALLASLRQRKTASK